MTQNSYLRPLTKAAARHKKKVEREKGLPQGISLLVEKLNYVAEKLNGQNAAKQR